MLCAVSLLAVRGGEMQNMHHQHPNPNIMQMQSNANATWILQSNQH
jgi:hypothetical protein